MYKTRKEQKFLQKSIKRDRSEMENGDMPGMKNRVGSRMENRYGSGMRNENVPIHARSTHAEVAEPSRDQKVKSQPIKSAIIISC
jgi:hypothetical protein